MKHKITYVLALPVFAAMLFIASCAKDEVKPYDHPFFHIMVDNKGEIDVLSNRKDTVDYKVYLSAQLQFEPITVQYEVQVGDGLKEGRDFDLITEGTTLTFPQGIFERPVRIAWKESTLDPAKNNTLIIRLLSNSKNFTMGLPGPDQLQKQLVITKK
ncbi:hypothetical protein [Pedobacter sp. MC2016-24]|uniref:hypothetical protein n=1 Tax=Pedobacter sp. MC2016-24 TaxID=2780090 RepID=UPI001D16F3D4|nr:hypothetical protein [Pedobacter sp. MC2016-24]